MLVLRYYEHQSNAQIAAVLGCAEGTVRNPAPAGSRCAQARQWTWAVMGVPRASIDVPCQMK